MPSSGVLFRARHDLYHPPPLSKTTPSSRFGEGAESAKSLASILKQAGVMP